MKFLIIFSSHFNELNVFNQNEVLFIFNEILPQLFFIIEILFLTYERSKSIINKRISDINIILLLLCFGLKFEILIEAQNKKLYQTRWMNSLVLEHK